MSADELALWQEANEALAPVLRARRPCHDCPREFAIEMSAEDRCNGTPPPHAPRPCPRGSPARSAPSYAGRATTDSEVTPWRP